MTDHELNRDRPRERRSRRLTTLAAITALGLGSLALAGCGNGEEEVPSTEAPAGEASSTMKEESSTMEEESSTMEAESSSMGQETDMEQDTSVESQDPATQQGQVLDQETTMDSKAASGDSASATAPLSENPEQDDDRSGS